ncbi:type I secretion C-terminal target domain (VC_A0849 subclass), partial [Duganella sp. CF517]|uniref:calcium-binding protein n=1 Tax=Duganella sp. CF517 TaxID=1881038 RepID=UPI0008C3BABF
MSVINGTGGDDTLAGTEQDDQLFGGAGNDILNDAGGNDLLDGGDGNDDLYGGAGRDTLLGGAGDDGLSVYLGVQLADGGAGNDVFYSGIGGGIVTGTATLIGGEGDDTFRLQYHNGSNGASTVQGGDGADVFEVVLADGNERQLTVSGGNGGDTYRISSVYHTANFTITDFAAGSGAGQDRIDLSAYLNDYSFTPNGNPFAAASGFFRLVQNGADVQLQYDHDGAAGQYHQWLTVVTLSNIRATSLTEDNFVHHIAPDGAALRGDAIAGTDGNDSLTGWIADDTIDGGAGNDTLAGNYGNDLLRGGADNDRLGGDIGNDTLFGGDGADTLYGDGDDQLDGGAGDDFLVNYRGNATLAGGEGNDAFLLQDGNATWTVLADGGAGDDTFTYNGDTSGSRFTVTGGAGVDTYDVHQSLSGLTRFTITDFSAGAGGDRLDLREQLSANSYNLSGYTGGNPFAPALGHLRLVQQGADTLLQMDRDGASGQQPFITVFTLKNVLAASLSADNLVGGYAPDGRDMPGLFLSGGADGDTLTGATLADTIDGYGGADVISGGQGDDLLRGGDEADGTPGDTIDGGFGNDTIEGGGGDDSVLGAAGSDLIDGGGGNDTLGGNDQFGGNSMFGRPNGDDTLLGGTGDDRLTGGDSSLLDGGAGNDTLFGGGSAAGGTGDDLIHIYSTDGGVVANGGDGNDTLDANDYNHAFNATMIGGAGIDTFSFNPYPVYHSSAYMVADFTAGAGGDRIDLLPLLASRDAIGYMYPDLQAAGMPFFKLAQQGNDTLLQLNYGSPLQPAFLTLAVLKNVNAASMTAANFHGLTLDGLGGDGLLVQGTGGADLLLGAHFADTLRGGDGDDTLAGGRGNDVLDGGAGDDRFSLNSNDGDDTVLGGDGDDQIALANWDQGFVTSSVTIDAGGGDDRMTFDGQSHGVVSARATGGAGSDTYAVTNPEALGRVVVTDFAAGTGGDRIDLEGLLSAYDRFHSDVDTGGNPFLNGLLRLQQDGADTLLQTHAGGALSGDWQTVLRLANVEAGALAAANFVGHVDPGGAPTAGLLVTDNGERVVSGGRYNDTVVGVYGNNILLGGGGDDLLLGTDAGETLVGESGADRVEAGGGDDLIEREGKNGGDDTLLGGDGNDLFRLSDYGPGERVLADGGAGDDSFELYLGGGSDDLSLTGGGGRDTYVPQAAYGDAGLATVLDFVAGAGGDRIDLIKFLAATGNQQSRVPDDPWAFDGTNPFRTGHARLVQSGADTLLQLDADGAGPEAFYTALVLKNLQAATLTADNFVGGTAPDGSLPPGLTVDGNSWSENITGSIYGDRLYGNGGRDTIDGGNGNDLIVGGDQAGDGDALDGGGGKDTLLGGGGNDYLAGGDGNDSLDGGAGVDTLYGGNGDDVFVLTDNADVIVWDAGVGTDTVRLNWQGAGAYTLARGVENLDASASRDGQHLLGNELDNVITGGAGADVLEGGAGDDTYRLADGADTVIEAADGGRDTVVLNWATAGQYVLGAGMENATAGAAQAAQRLTGNALDNALTGGAHADTLDGGAGDDTLDGGAGNDSMAGGAGNDVYLVDAGGDKIVEAAGAGRDRVVTTLAAYVLDANIEDLKAGGDAAFSGTGNALANVLESGSGNDTLNGGAGADTLAGGAGDDVYIIDTAADLVVESAGGGVDAVRIAFATAGAYTLAGHVENAMVTAAAAVAVTLTGNELDNLLTGNGGASTINGGAGDDTLDGGAGNDKLNGGSGDDLYLVDAAGDVVTELTGEGTDTVRASQASYTLTANVEHLAYTGKAAFTGTGNVLDNIITGGHAGNKLDGGAGNDRLVGGDGADSLIGGLGDDTFVGASGKDTIDGGAGTDLLQGLGKFGDYTVTRVTATDTMLADKAGSVIAVRGVENFAFADGDKTLAQVQDNVPSAGNDSLHGSNGNDVLNGGLGVDTLSGGLGDDTYVLLNAADVVLENAG